MTLQTVLNELAHQLDWRGPTGRCQGTVVLARADAQVLVQEVHELQLLLVQLLRLQRKDGGEGAIVDGGERPEGSRADPTGAVGREDAGAGQGDGSVAAVAAGEPAQSAELGDGQVQGT